MSNEVLPPQVASVAVPETVGVHWKTCSPDVLLAAHVPLSALVPPVALANVPP